MATSTIRTKPLGWVVAAATATATVFAIDLLTPRGIAVPMLYVLPILLTWLAPGLRSTVLMGGAAVAGTWVRVWLSTGEFAPAGFTNRLMVSALLLVVTGLLAKQKQVSRQVADVLEARRQSEAQLRLFVEHAPAAIAMLDARMCYVVTSRRWLKDYGLVGQSLRGRSHYDVFPEIEERWKEVHSRCLAGAVEGPGEDVFVRADGSRQWLRWEVRPWYTAMDVVGGIVIFIEDITKRKQAEEALCDVNATLERRVHERTNQLAEANERWGLVMRATNDGVWDWDVLHDRVSFSPRWKAMHGFDEQDKVESSKEWSESIHPEDRARVMEKLEAYWKQQQPEFWEEYRMQRKDGTWMWVLDRGVAVWDEQGQVVRMAGAEMDITWRKEAEEALRRQEHEFRTLADNVPAFFSYVNRDRRYRFVNEPHEKLFQQPSDQIVGSTMQELLGTEGYAEVERYLDAAFCGQEVSFEYRLPGPGDGEQWFSARYVPDRDGRGRVVGLFILLADVTKFKLSEANLREKEQQLRDLSARLIQAQEEERRRIAQELHDDVTQRLASLAIDLRRVQRDAQGLDPMSVRRLRQLGDSAERLATDLQQVAHQLHPSILEHVGLEAAVREQVDEFAARTGLKADLLVRNLPSVVPLEQSLCLYRVLQESLRNVQKHAKATHVLVRLLGIGRGLALCVHDDGCGIESMERATLRKGLGLTSMEERVGALQGTFRIRGNSGDGTEIHAWVPLEGVNCET